MLSGNKEKYNIDTFYHMNKLKSIMPSKIKQSLKKEY